MKLTQISQTASATHTRAREYNNQKISSHVNTVISAQLWNLWMRDVTAFCTLYGNHSHFTSTDSWAKERNKRSSFLPLFKWSVNPHYSTRAGRLINDFFLSIIKVHSYSRKSFDLNWAEAVKDSMVTFKCQQRQRSKVQCSQCCYDCWKYLVQPSLCSSGLHSPLWNIYCGQLTSKACF